MSEKYTVILLQIQTIEQKLLENAKELKKLKKTIKSKDGVVEIEANYSMLKEKSQRAQLEFNQNESEIKVLEQKLSEQEKKLYSGVVKDVKTLQAVEQELAYIEEQLDNLTQNRSSLKKAHEQAQIELLKVEENLKSKSEEWNNNQPNCINSWKKIKEQFDEKKVEVAKLFALVPMHVVEIYTVRRHSKRGRAVTSVSGGVCQGCYVKLPKNEIIKLQQQQAIHVCSNCDRIVSYES